MSGHTPGPWTYRYEGADSYYIAHQSPGHHGAEFAHVEATHHTREALDMARANARLIAAAPDLLEALQRLHANDGQEEHDAARAAIRKATEPSA